MLGSDYHPRWQAVDFKALAPQVPAVNGACRIGHCEAGAKQDRKFDRRMTRMPATGGNNRWRPSAFATLTFIALAVVVLTLAAACSDAGSAAQNAPVISDVRVVTVSTTSAELSWDVEPASSGQVEYGKDPSYGSRSALEPELLPTHVQELQDLDPGTEYHFRVIAVDEAGQESISGDAMFTTEQGPQQQPSATGIYGSGIAADVKNNQRIDGTRLAHRFRASTTANLVAIRFQQRGGPGYSLGDGGRMRVSVQTTSGPPDHVPSGTVLADVRLDPGNPDGDWTSYERYAFDQPPRLSEGRVYHIVFENLDGAPEENYISVNELFVFDRADAVHPALSDMYAVLSRSNGSWRLQPRDVADMDLEYDDGTRDGQSYIENMCALFGVISGPEHMVRERFTVTGGERQVTSVGVRVKRNGGDAPLMVRLEDGDGALLESVEIPADSLESADPGCTRGGAGWLSADFSAEHRLLDGSTYQLVLGTTEGTTYSADPIREGTDREMLSYRFTDGDGQFTDDGGRSWTSLYEWSPVDLQFYFR